MKGEIVKMETYKTAHILLVEDSHLDEVLTLDAFREARLQNTIHVARSGEEALDYLFNEGQFADRKVCPLPDLVLLDLKLPGISGHEVLTKLKATPTLKRVPVIVLTSSKEEGDLEMSYDRGANSYLVKPVTFDGFLRVVQQVQDYWLSLNVMPPK
jgi:CheY-like chemotaxis protein